MSIAAQCIHIMLTLHFVTLVPHWEGADFTGDCVKYRSFLVFPFSLRQYYVLSRKLRFCIRCLSVTVVSIVVSSNFRKRELHRWQSTADDSAALSYFIISSELQVTVLSWDSFCWPAYFYRTRNSRVRYSRESQCERIVTNLVVTDLDVAVRGRLGGILLLNG